MSIVDRLYNKKTLIILGVIVLILVILVLINQKSGTALKKIGDTLTGAEPKVEVATTSEANIMEEFDGVKKPARVPEPNEKLSEEQKKELAVPAISIPAAPGSIAKLRSFSIQAEKNQFIPAKIMVNFGDTVNIKFTAVDANYDIIFDGYNTRQRAIKGETKVLEFQAIRAGDYTFYCEQCGGINGPVKGVISVLK